ncbi:MAG TPA: glycine oxidase ThiO, partial [Candidatus Binataceae bacterium]|nr:glycine oxidase ThiO [Candidatus Binataceae bacterium]
MKAVVIGGGIIGCSVAWRLAAEGVATTVLERGRVGQEASWAAAGMIAPQAEADGPGPFFDFCLRARDVFEEIVDRLVRDGGVDPEYDRAGILYVALDAVERAELERRARWQRAAGAPVEEIGGAEARRLEPALSPEVTYALHLPTNRRTDNRKLTQAYAAAARKAGAEFVEGARVDAVAVRGGRATGVVMDDGAVRAADIVINAAGSWAGEIRGLEADRVRLHPVRGQIVCFEAQPGTIGPALFSLRGYLVPRRDGRLLAGSTMEEAGYNKTVTLAGLEKIARGAAAMAPALGAIAFRQAWAGLRPATRDLLPVLGFSPSVPNVIWAAGHFRSGILLSAITGEVVADLVKGRRPAIDLAPFSAARFREQ